jgi:hypothetical protein
LLKAIPISTCKAYFPLLLKIAVEKYNEVGTNEPNGYRCRMFGSEIE